MSLNELTNIEKPLDKSVYQSRDIDAKALLLHKNVLSIEFQI